MADTSEIEELIARVALSDRQAFARLYKLTSAKLFGVCLRVLSDRAAAEDALQDGYMKIWRNADRYTANGLSPMTWMITIARNTAIDRLRKARPVDDLDEIAERVSSPEAGPEASAIARSELGRIRECMDELDEQRARAIRGAYLEGHSYKDLSDALSVPLNTIRTWLRRGLISLHECMGR